MAKPRHAFQIERMRIVVLAALLPFAFCVMHAGAQTPSSTGTAACVGSWSPPSPMRRVDGKPVFVDWDGLATTIAGKPLVLGPSFFWMSADRPAPTDGVVDTAQAIWSVTRAGAIVDAAGIATAVPMVDSLKVHVRPRLIAWTPRAIDVAWSVSDSARPDVNNLRADRIEISSFDGARWTAPRTILRGANLQMDPPMVVRAGTAFEQRVVAARTGDSHGDLVRVARRVGDEWPASDWRPPGSLILLQAMPASDGSVAMVYFGSVTDAGSGVFAQRFTPRTDGGVAWSEPERVDSLRGSFGPPASARLGGDSLVVVWEENVVQAASDRLQTALSVDGGRHWRLMKSMSFDALLRGTRLVVDTHGRLHLLVGATSAAGAKTEKILHALWSSDGWTAPDTVAPDFGYVSVAPMDDGRLLAEWSTIDMTAGGIAPRSLSSVWSPGCVR